MRITLSKSLSRRFEHARFCERLEHTFRDTPRPLFQAERRRLAARIDLDNFVRMATSTPLRVRPRSTPPIGRAQPDLSNRCE
jgi:hypothetical protein